MKLEKFSIGIGDRFAHQGSAQLDAIKKAKEKGISITPVWNKSNREHSITKTSQTGTRVEADNAVKAASWRGAYRVDADHINLSNVEKFLASSDFFTIDVADYIGNAANKNLINNFISRSKSYTGEFVIPGFDKTLKVTNDELENIAKKYLTAISEAGKIYRFIESKKGADNFITEVSMDEVDIPQSPIELFFILSLLAEERVPLQTVAPRFVGQFNKGVDYVGNVASFAKQFEEYLMVISFARQQFKLPDNLKLSIHSGSDKFSLYPSISELTKKHNAGFHLKTAGTTWLEEMIGLALADETTLDLVKKIYSEALLRIDELTLPYKTVIDIDRSKLPPSDVVMRWSREKYANTLRHIPDHPDYNPHFRQLIHVSYKVAVEHGNEFISGLKKYSGLIGQQVTENLYDRHIARLFNVRN